MAVFPLPFTSHRLQESIGARGTALSSRRETELLGPSQKSTASAMNRRPGITSHWVERRNGDV